MRLSPSIAVLLVTLSFSPIASAQESLAEAIGERVQPLIKALSLLGTPYRYGSSKPEQGLDCSGLVTHVYKETAGVDLPRSARDMSRAGQEVARDELRPGDLVFFNTRKQPYSHVCIYAGDGRFIHASSRSDRQVTISRMDTRYWASRFNGARRVLSLD